MNVRSNIRDVAARAGVAVKTVSRVLNGHPYVSADTRARVEEAMRALDFRPSIAARILSGAKSNQIALIYDNHSPYYMFQIQNGCWTRCQQDGIRLLAQPVDVADPKIGEQVRGLVSENWASLTWYDRSQTARSPLPGYGTIGSEPTAANSRPWRS